MSRVRRDKQLRKDMGQRIRRLRRQRGISAAILAERIGLQTSAVFHIETAIGGVSVETLLRLAEELDTTTDYLLCRTPELAATAVEGVVANG